MHHPSLAPCGDPTQNATRDNPPPETGACMQVLLPNSGTLKPSTRQVACSGPVKLIHATVTQRPSTMFTMAGMSQTHHDNLAQPLDHTGLLLPNLNQGDCCSHGSATGAHSSAPTTAGPDTPLEGVIPRVRADHTA